MLSFIYNNLLLIIGIGVVIFLYLVYLFIKSLPTKVEKKDDPQKDRKEDKKERPIKNKDTDDKKKKEKKGKSEKIEQSEEKKEEKPEEKKEKKTPKIVQVYKREQLQEQKQETKSDSDSRYDRDVEFVNTSKNIAKFKSFKDETPAVTSESETGEKDIDAKDEYGFTTEKEEDCEYCEAHTKHFDHSKRLSKYIHEKDDMFASHISDKYMNIDSDKHLNLNERFNKSMFDRANKMMDNSENKMGNSFDGKNDYIRDWLISHNGDEVLEEESGRPEMTLETLMVADMYLNRKKKK